MEKILGVLARMKQSNFKRGVTGAIILVGSLAFFQNCGGVKPQSMSQNSSSNSSRPAMFRGNGGAQSVDQNKSKSLKVFAHNKSASVASGGAPFTCNSLQAKKVASNAIPGLVTTSVTHYCSNGSISTFPVSSTYSYNGRIISSSRVAGSKPQ